MSITRDDTSYINTECDLRGHVEVKNSSLQNVFSRSDSWFTDSTVSNCVFEEGVLLENSVVENVGFEHFMWLKGAYIRHKDDVLVIAPGKRDCRVVFYRQKYSLTPKVSYAGSIYRLDTFLSTFPDLLPEVITNAVREHFKSRASHSVEVKGEKHTVYLFEDSKDIVEFLSNQQLGSLIFAQRVERVLYIPQLDAYRLTTPVGYLIVSCNTEVGFYKLDAEVDEEGPRLPFIFAEAARQINTKS